MKKQELMSLCRDENDIHDCGLCSYEFTDTCMLRLEEIEKRRGGKKKNEQIKFVEFKNWSC